MSARFCIARCRRCASGGKRVQRTALHGRPRERRPGLTMSRRRPAQEEVMDENSLYGLRRDPPEEFARQLLKTLHEQPEGPRYGGKLVAALAATAALVAVFAVPSVRAAAQAFLDMFRVVNFAAVPVDEQAMQRLVGKQYGLAQ